MTLHELVEAYKCNRPLNKLQYHRAVHSFERSVGLDRDATTADLNRGNLAQHAMRSSYAYRILTLWKFAAELGECELPDVTTPQIRRLWYHYRGSGLRVKRKGFFRRFLDRVKGGAK